MKFLKIAILVLLAGCVTTQQNDKSFNVKNPSEWSFGENVGFTKSNFSLEKYAQASYTCYNSTNNSSEKLRIERFESCMGRVNKYNTGTDKEGYKLSLLSGLEIEKRNNAVKAYFEQRTYREGKFFDKPDFNDAEFLNAVQNCSDAAKKLKRNSAIAPYGTGIAGGLVFSAINGFNSAEDSRYMSGYFNECILNKGYVYNSMPKEEIERRQYLLK